MNNIATFKVYIDLLDEVYKKSSMTSVLDGDNTLVRAGANAGEIIIPKISMDGLGDYSRTTGYVDGGVTLEYETIKADYDRGRKFNVDAMDNIETAGVAFGKLSSAFIKEKVIPELDAWRFAKYAAMPGILTVSEDYASGAEVLDGLIKCQNEMDENEVPTEDRILFITPTLLNMARNVDTTRSKEVLASFAEIKSVPQTRFVTAIDLFDGKTDGEETGHFQKSAGGKNLNFMGISKSAVVQHQKHTVNKIISPEDNQNADAWIFAYRTLGIATAYEKKVKGIYTSVASI